jgi:hypothetical protein
MNIPIPEKYAKAITAIQDLYEHHGAGGYGHVVFDDGNHDSVEWCLNEAINATNANLYDDAEDHRLTRELSIKALEACKNFSEDEANC